MENYRIVYVKLISYQFEPTRIMYETMIIQLIKYSNIFVLSTNYSASSEI